MKKFSAIMFTVAAVVLMTACNNVEKILPKKDGTWNISMITETETVNRTVTSDTTYSPVGTSFTFDKDGTGTYTEPDTTDSFTWAYNDDNETITMTLASFPLAIVYDVLESSKDAQTWRYTFTFDDGTDVEVDESTFELERAE